MLEYARKGLIGLLTPQANTTAEAEFGLLAPPGLGLVTARLASPAPSLAARLVEYVGRADETLDQFADAPLTAAAFACTGSSYVIGRDREAEWAKRIEAARRYPFLTAAGSVASALDALDVKRVAVVSPYDADLTAAALAYWRACGFEVIHVEPAPAAAVGHAIYGIGADAATTAAARAADRRADAVVLLGTGMPTLRAILEGRPGGPPRLSSVLCLAWLATARAQGATADATSLHALRDGAAWASRVPSLPIFAAEPAP